MKKDIWASKQLTEEQAIKFADSSLWENLSYKQIVDFQLFQQRLCMPFDIFQQAMEEALNRPVFTHSFALRDNLVEEYLGTREVPDVDEVLSTLPKNKLNLIFSD